MSSEIKYPVPVRGVVTFTNGSQFNFEQLNEYTKEFQVLDESVMVARERSELPKPSSINYLNIKTLVFGEVIKKTKEFYYSGSSGEKLIENECAWVPVKIITQDNAEFDNMYVTVTGDWGCGQTQCTESLSFVKSGFVRTAKIATIRKVEFT